MSTFTKLYAQAVATKVAARKAKKAAKKTAKRKRKAAKRTRKAAKRVAKRERKTYKLRTSGTGQYGARIAKREAKTDRIRAKHSLPARNKPAGETTHDTNFYARNAKRRGMTMAAYRAKYVK